MWLPFAHIRPLAVVKMHKRLHGHLPFGKSKVKGLKVESLTSDFLRLGETCGEDG
jgi:hypothetical protein